MPRDLPETSIQHHWGVIGNQATCDAQGSITAFTFTVLRSTLVRSH